jgi:hypothetical protein
MSGAGAAHARSARARRVARRWLPLAALAMANAGCLITSTPQFTAEQHTPPFLVEATAIPNPAEIHTIDMASLPTEQQFSAHVVSQDDPSGSFSEVVSALFINLGANDPGTRPYLGLPIPGSHLAQPGTLDDTSRIVSADWQFSVVTPPMGCNTATLVATHNFDFGTGCPCAGDYSQITWMFLVCDSSMPGSCDDLAIDSCPQKANMLTNSCAIYEAAVEGDAGPMCPAGATAGTP